MRAAFITLVVALIAAAVIIAMKPSRQSGVIVLPGGLEMELLGTAVGSATFTTDKRWHKFARRILPIRWQRWIPASNSGSCSSGTNSITVYFRVTEPSGARILNRPWEYYQVQDDTGLLYNREGGYCSFGGTSNSTLYGLSLRAFPRRQPDFQFSLIDAKGSNIANVRVPNPVRGPFPIWEPQPLPQTLTNGPVILTLKSIRAQGRGPWHYISPAWKLESSDPAWTKAKVRYMTLIDATGNEGQMLSPQEPAWMLRTMVHREREEDFSPAERFIISNLVVPKPGEFIAVDQSAVRQGIELKPSVFAGPGEFVISNGIRSMLPPRPAMGGGHSSSGSSGYTTESWANSNHFVLVNVQGAKVDDEIRVYAISDNGTRLRLNDTGYHGDAGGGRRYQLVFTPPDNAGSMALEIIVSRPLKFEFLVDPKDMQKN